MKHTEVTPTKNRGSVFGIVAVLALSLVVSMAINGSVRADPAHDRGHDPGWDRHARDAGRWHSAHPHYVPGYVEAPPVVYYPPPAQPSGLNLIIPLNIH